MSEFKLKVIGSNMTELHFPKCDIFFSYETPVAAYSWMDGFVVTDEYHSKTTTTHINKWLKQNGVSPDAIKNMKKVPVSYFKNIIRLNVEQV
jgi:hypothetical protein